MSQTLNPNDIVRAQVQYPGELVAAQELLRIEDQIGSGGMATVFRVERLGAIESDPFKYVAMKVIDPSLMEREAGARFLGEARVLQRLSHPNIASFVGSGVTANGDNFYLAEFVQGYTLTQVHLHHASACGRTVLYQRADGEQERSLTFAECINGPKISGPAMEYSHIKIILNGILQALICAHQNGIVHRDLKPDNVLIEVINGQVGNIKVIDFGIAKVMGGLEETQHTKTGTVIGTPEYMSPEQMLGNRDVDNHCDLYAVGLICLALLTGLRYINIQDPQAIAFCSKRLLSISTAGNVEDREASFDVLKYVDGVPEPIRHFVLKATSYHVADRYHSAEEMLSALNEAFSDRVSDPAFAQTLLDPRMLRTSVFPAFRQLASVARRTGDVVAKGTAWTARKIWRWIIIPAIVGSLFIGAGMFAWYSKTSEGEKFLDQTAEQVQMVSTKIEQVITLQQGGSAAESQSADVSRTESVQATEASQEAGTASDKNTKMNEVQRASFKAGKMMLMSGKRSKALKIFLDLEHDGIKDPELLRALSEIYRRTDKTKSADYALRAATASRK